VNFFDVLIVQPIFNLLLGLYSIIPGGDFGVAIIIFTVFVRFLLYPLTKSMLHQTRVMRKLQPELVKIRKQTKNNKQLAAVQMMEMYKKHGVNPYRPIGILLIQLPIFIGLYYVIQIFTQYRHDIGKFTYDFLEGIGPVKQLIDHPDQFNEKLLNFVDLTKTAFHQGGIEWFLILLAIIAGVTQYIMSKQTTPQSQSKRRLRDIMAEAAEGKEADQSEMNAIVMGKMTKILPFFMFVVMISLPGAIALYYATSNIVAVLQQGYLIRRDEEEMETMADKALSKEAKAASKKATHKARKKVAKEAKVTKITAKDTRGGKS
jgi:YidC/Oxa1 family membrane protein insertase